MKLFNQPLQLYFTYLANKLKKSLYHPQPAQNHTLRKLANQLGASPLAQRFGFSKSITAEQMRALPITSYEVMKEEISLIGEKGAQANGLFGRSSLMALALTSGTTHEPKRIPITQDYVKAYRRFTLIMNASYFARTGQNNIAQPGRTLLLTARPHISNTAGGLPECFISGFMASNAPYIYRKKVLPSKEILRLPTWDEKMGAVLDEARNHNVRSIAGVPALVLSFSEFAQEKLGVKTLREIWPELEGLIYSGSSLTEIQKGRFENIWGATGKFPLTYWEMYSATEAQIGHTFDPSWPGMVFNPFENFYQFLEEGKGSALQLHEVEAGKRYVILITTPGGLINYRTGDWVEILSTRPLTFRVCGRDQDEISVGWEKINMKQIVQTVAATSKQISFTEQDYVVYVKEGRPNSLVFGISDSGEVPFDQLASFLDRELAQVNPNYKELRINNMMYGPLQVKRLPSSIFGAYRNRNLDRGQFKPKQLFKSEEAFKKEYGLNQL